jgi:hypothetical protein
MVARSGSIRGCREGPIDRVPQWTKSCRIGARSTPFRRYVAGNGLRLPRDDAEKADRRLRSEPNRPSFEAEPYHCSLLDRKCHCV